MLRNILLVVAFFLLSLLVSCSFSFETAEAYEQQYNVGDTGPNGGIVTSVTVESILSDSSIQLVGDFEETTYTYTHTETITEEVETTEYIQQNSYEIVSTETTNNLITTATKSTSGNILDHTYSGNTGHVHTDYTGNSITFSEELTNYLDVTEINEGFDLYGQADVYACTNQIGGHCSSGNLDTFTITLTVIDPTTGEDYIKTTSWSVGHTWQTYQTSFSIPSNTLGSDTLAIATFYGIDNGYWAGYYGPVIDDMRMWAVYSQVQEVITLVENIVTEQVQSVITSQTYEVDSVYIPPVFDPIDLAPVEVLADFTIEISADFEEIITMDFEIVETDSGGMEMEITTMEGDMEIDVEIVEIDMEEMSVEVEVAQEESDSEPTSEAKEDSKEEKSSDTKETIAQKIVEKVASTGDQVALSNVKLAVMAQLTDTKAFEDYQSKNIVDINVDEYLIQNIEDPYGVIFSLAQDQLMEEMVNQQYGRN